jgi:hypothetical protein
MHKNSGTSCGLPVHEQGTTQATYTQLFFTPLIMGINSLFFRMLHTGCTSSFTQAKGGYLQITAHTFPHNPQLLLKQLRSI